MDCQEVQSLVLNDLSNDLDISTQGRVIEHLGQCQVCTQLVQELKLVDYYYKESLGQLPTSRFLPADFTSRVYERIQLEQKISKRYLIYKAIAAAAVILIGLASYFLLTTSQGHILDGALYVEREGKTIVCKDLLPIGQTLKTSEGQSAKIKLRDSSIIKMFPDTILTLKHDSRLNGRLLSLEQGELHCQVAKGGGFSIQMPGAELKTLGTEFIVRMSTNRKEITTSQSQLLSFMTSATVKVAVSSGNVLLTIDQGQQEIKAGETVIREVNPPLPVELQTEIKELINQLGNENELIRQEAFARLTKIGYVSVPILEDTLSRADSIQQPYINRLLERFSGPELLWSYEIPETGFALHPSVVSEDQLFIVGGSGLYALDCFTGEVNWKFQQGDFNSAPFLNNGIIYIGTLGGDFFAIESKEGKIIWQKTGLGVIQSTPTLGNNTIYIGSGEPGTKRGRFYALDAGTGKIKWTFATPGMIACCRAVVFNDKLVLFGTWNNKLYALNVRTGELAWRYETGGIITISPRVDIDNDLVYFGSWDRRFYILSAQSGQKQWSFQADSAIIEPPLKAGKIIYWGTKHKIYAFDLERRMVSWTYNRERSTLGGIMAVVGERIYLGTDGGQVLALNVATGEKECDFQIPGPEVSYNRAYYEIAGSPAIFNNVLYIASRSVGAYSTGNKVYALDLQSYK